jgi:hypothetical protein
VNDLTTLAYFSVDVNADGTLDPEWRGMERVREPGPGEPGHPGPRRRGPGRAHRDLFRARARSTQLTSDPNAPARLSAGLIAAVSAKNLDGVNFDFEGEGSADQVGLTSLIPGVGALHAANPTGR